MERILALNRDERTGPDPDTLDRVPGWASACGEPGDGAAIDRRPAGQALVAPDEIAVPGSISESPRARSSELRSREGR